MVSLGEDSERQGAYFFGNENAPLTPDDEEPLTRGLQIEEEPKFKPMRTEFVAIIQMIVIVLYILTVVLFPFVFAPYLSPGQKYIEQQRDALSIMVYSQVGVWCLLVLAERYLHFRHRESLRQGYLKFYRETQRMKRIPVYTFAVGNAAILLIVMMTLDLNWDKERTPTGFSTLPICFFLIVSIIEGVVSIPGCLKYTVMVFRFNSRRDRPDVEHEELIAAAMQPGVNMPSVGFRDGSYVDNLLEKQADLIHYLRQHAEHLSKRILILKEGQNDKHQQMNDI